MFDLLIVGLFCQHVVAIFEHIRLDKIPDKYILQRYSNDPVTDPEFNRRDYLHKEDDETTLQYRRTILYNEALKTVNKGCSSDQMFDKALAAFKEVNARLLDEETVLNSKSSHDSPQVTVSSDNPEPESGSASGPYAHIQPPLMSKTKGSKSKQTGKQAGTTETSAPTRPDPEVDENRSEERRVGKECRL